MEIERKFLIQNPPSDYKQFPCKEIEQGYLCRNPVLRIRRSNDQFFLTVKGEGLLMREEHELPLTEETYYQLKSKVDGNFIQKTRYLIPYNEALTIELDVFSGKLAPLILAEVEFSSVEEAASFVPPAWFGEDVTNSAKYHNSNLSQLS